jgi:hypothetical protein
VDTRHPSGPLKYESHQSSSLDGSVSALFFNFFSLGVHGNRDRDTSISFEVESATTSTFEPTKEYLDKSLLQDAVVKLAREKKPSIYMVVGLRVAHGAKITYTSGRGGGGGIDAGPFGAAAGGSPIDASVKVKGRTSQSSSQTTTLREDFVMAYRLRKCRYMRDVKRLDDDFYKKRRSAMMHGVDFPTGTAVAGNDGDPRKEITEIIISPDGMDKRDVDAYSLETQNLRRSSTDDDGCDCIILALRE